jgi:hypothetical protein
MSTLSPAAQAVVNAKLSPAAAAVYGEAYVTSADEPGVFVAYGDCLAAAIRAVAMEVVLPKYQFADWEMADLIMTEIQAIAAELEDAQ